MSSDAVRTETRQILSAELRQGNPISLSVKTASMSPALKPDDVLTLQSIPPDKLNIGDIVLFELNNEWITHRIIAKRPSNGQIDIITRGDNALLPDPPVLLQNILGKITGIRRNGSEIPISAESPKGDMDETLLMASFPSRHNNIPENFDQKELLAAANRESLSPLLHYYWSSSIKHAYLSSLARNALFLDKLAELSGELSGIKFILLKGAYLASHVYPSPGLRLFSDIDILVRQDQLQQVNSILHALGYKQNSFPENQIPLNLEPSPLNSIMYRPEEGPSIHVHWHVFNSILPKYKSATMDIQELWKSARETRNGWLVLCPEHTLIHLSEHALRHSYDHLILLRDIAEVILKQGNEIDWNRLVEDAVKFNLARPVYYSLALTSMKTAVHVPGSALTGLRPERPGLCERLFLRLSRTGRRSPELCNLVYIDSLHSFRDKAAFIRHALFPSRNVLARAYHKQPHDIGPLTYAFRLVRGMKYITNAAARILSTQPRAAL